MHGFMGDGLWMGMMWFWPLLLVAVVVAVLWAVLRGSRREEQERPEEILKRRYARGEIDEEEYRRKMDELRR